MSSLHAWTYPLLTQQNGDEEFFYWVDLSPDDAPKLALTLSTQPGANPLFANPFVTPIGLNNSTPRFFAITETITDITNAAISQLQDNMPPHVLDTAAGHFYALHHATNLKAHIVPRGPCFTFHTDPVKYVDIFVDDFVDVAQHPHPSRVRQSLLHAINSVIHPLGPNDSPQQQTTQTEVQQCD